MEVGSDMMKKKYTRGGKKKMLSDDEIHRFKRSSRWVAGVELNDLQGYGAPNQKCQSTAGGREERRTYAFG